MKILIVNAYPRSPKGLHSFDDFHWSIKKFMDEQKEFVEIETEYVLREKETIDDFLYEPYSGYAKIENAKLFDHLDMVFISGDNNLLPWHSSAQKNINVINGKSKGGKIGDLSQLSKPLNELTSADFFLDNVTGDIYNYNLDKEEWQAKYNVGLHYEKAAQEYYTLGKFMLKTPTYRVKTPNSENIYISKNTELICYLKKIYVSHYLLQNLPFEFLIPSKPSWIIHTFSFINREKTFIVLAETNRAPSIILLRNCIGVEFEISFKYPASIEIMKNFIRHHMKIIKTQLHTSDSIVDFFTKIEKMTLKINIDADKDREFEARRKINFNVFEKSRLSTHDIYDDKTIFKHVGYTSSLKHKNTQIIKNNAIFNEPFKLPKFNKNIKTEENFHKKKEKNYRTEENEKSFNNLKDVKPDLKKSIRALLHPTISDDCLKDNKVWVPGNLSKLDYSIQTRNSSLDTKIELDKLKESASFHKFREMKKDKWLADNFKFGRLGFFDSTIKYKY